MSITLGAVGIGALLSQPRHSFVGWTFMVVGVLAAVAAVVSANSRHTIAFQSPIIFSGAAPRGSFAWNSTLTSLVVAVEMMVIGALIASIFISSRRMSSRLSQGNSAFSEYAARRDKERRAQRQIPAPYSPEDAEILIRELTPTFRTEEYKFQIIREDDDVCKRFADNLSDILRRSKWTEVSPVSSPAPNAALPLGITIRGGTILPASRTANHLNVALRDVGTFVDSSREPELRRYDYAIICISDNGYLPKE